MTRLTGQCLQRSCTPSNPAGTVAFDGTRRRGKRRSRDAKRGARPQPHVIQATGRALHSSLPIWVIFPPNLGYIAVVTDAVRPIDAILTKTQQRVLALLFTGEAERSLNELVRRSGGGSGAIRREVERMAAAGLLRERRVGNQRRFSADRASPLFTALAALAVQSIEPAPQRSARRPRPSAALLAGRAAVKRALAGHGLTNPRVFGSVARGEDTAASDLDLLVDAPRGISLLDLVKAKHAVEDILGVPVDLLTLNDLPESHRAAALAEAVPL